MEGCTSSQYYYKLDAPDGMTDHMVELSPHLQYNIKQSPFIPNTAPRSFSPPCTRDHERCACICRRSLGRVDELGSWAFRNTRQYLSHVKQ